MHRTFFSNKFPTSACKFICCGTRFICGRRLPLRHRLGDAVMFGSQLFDVYDNAKVDIALIEAGEDSQEHALNRIKGRSKFDLDDTTRRINQRPMVLPKGP